MRGAAPYEMATRSSESLLNGWISSCDVNGRRGAQYTSYFILITIKYTVYCDVDGGRGAQYGWQKGSVKNKV